jgi:hypothetical protein
MKIKSIHYSMAGLILLVVALAICFVPETRTKSPAVIEFVTDNLTVGKLTNDLLEWCESNHPDATVYRWKNHLVLFGEFKEPRKTLMKMEKIFPNEKIRIYTNPFYEFNRKECDDKQTTDRWTHVVMTANMVADERLQREYLNYHERQKDLFPEVAAGFCNADFQRLLIFRDGRQLMLIISIPEGKTLDELNPKTTENNPRVDLWNAIMSKYQEGIEGTAPNETWVILHYIINTR